MTLKLIGQPQGKGKVFRKDDGSLVAEVEYHLKIYHDTQQVAWKTGSQSIPGDTKVEGRVTGLDNAAFWGVSVQLVLQLQDGRMIDFQLHSLNGDIDTQGPFYDAP